MDCSLLVLDSPVLPLTVSKPNADKRANQPEDRTEESKRLYGPPAIARPAARDSTPVESTRVAGISCEENHQGERSEPGQAQEDVHTPGEEAAGEWDQPYEAKEHGQCRNDEGIDEAGVRPAVPGVLVDEFATAWSACFEALPGQRQRLCYIPNDAGANGCKGNFADPERDRYQPRDDRHNGWSVVCGRMDT